MLDIKPDLKLSARLPFSGFYHSTWDGEVDHFVEQEVDHLNERLNRTYYADEPPFKALADLPDNLPDLDAIRRRIVEKVCEDLWDKLDYRAIYADIAKDYAEAFGWWLDEALDDVLPGKHGGIEFEELTSPRFYNFETDRIFAKVPAIAFVRIINALPPGALNAAFQRLFTSRDGFISHYDNHIPDKPLADWDHNELYAVLVAFVDTQFDRNSTYGDLDGALHEALHENIWLTCQAHTDWEKLEAEAADLVAEALEEAGEDVPADWVPTYRCPHTPDLFA